MSTDVKDQAKTAVAGRGPGPNKRTLLWRSLQIWARLMVTLCFRFRAYGAEHVPASGGVMLASNHQSYLDPVLVAVALRRPVGFFANAYLFKNPAFSWLIRNLHAFPVERGKGDRAAVATAIEKLKEGYAVNIFPEGTRTSDGQIKPMERGVVLIARKAGVPVVPVAIDGAFDAWPRKHKVFRPHPIHVMYGKPIDPSKMDAQEFLSQLEGQIRTMHAELIRRREELRM